MEKNFKIYSIVAVSQNGVLGKDGKMPWRVPEDLKLFKSYTLQHRVIMGSKTFASLGNKPLEKRENIVLSKKLKQEKQVKIFSDIADLDLYLTEKKDDGKKNFIIGGGEIYSQFIPKTDIIYISKIQKEVAGDVFFCDFKKDFEKRATQNFPNATIPFVFETWHRIKN